LEVDCAAFALLILVGFTPALRGQSTNASVTGRISDPSKAVIADAKIAAIRAGTEVRYETTSNASGEYYLANLPPGPYRIEIEKAGFKKLMKTDMILHVQDTVALDCEMAVGELTESITAVGGVPLLNTQSTQSPTVSTVVDRTFADNIPLNGRSFQTLILLTPGVVVTATALDDQGQFSVNGQRADANYFTVDGVSANFGVSARRLAIAQQVAFAKWDSGAPVENASGEEHVIVSATEAGQLRGLNQTSVSNFFRAQIEANKLVQYSLLAEWHRVGKAPDHTPVILPRRFVQS